MQILYMMSSILSSPFSHLSPLLFSPLSPPHPSLLLSSLSPNPHHPSYLSQFSNSRDVPIVSLRRTTSNTTPGIGGGPRSLLYNSFNKAENNVIVTSDAEVLLRVLCRVIFIIILMHVLSRVILVVTITYLLL